MVTVAPTFTPPFSAIRLKLMMWLVDTDAFGMEIISLVGVFSRVEKVSRRRPKGVVGSGVSRVLIETASGDVTIAQKGEAAKPA